MARITWQNVTAPDLSTSRAALQQAGNSLTSGFAGFADSFRDIEQQQKDAYSQEALARLAQVSDPNQLNALMASDGLAGLGVTDSRYLNADAMQSILGRPKALFDNQYTAASTASTEATRLKTLFDTFANQQKLPGELLNQEETLNLTREEIRTAQQTYDYNAEANPERLKELKTNISRLEQEIEVSGNQDIRAGNQDIRAANEDTRAKEKWEEELRLAKLEKKHLENAGKFAAGLAGLNTKDAIEDYFAKASQNLKGDSTFYGDKIRTLLINGADAYFDPINAANTSRAAAELEADNVAAANTYWNDLRFGALFAGSTREDLVRRIEMSPGVSREVKHKLLEKLKDVSDELFKPTKAATAFVTNSDDSLVSPYNASITQRRQDLTRRATSDPLFEFAKFWNGEPESKIVGAAQDLRDRLRDSEGRVFSGASNAGVTKIINQVTKELSGYNIPADAIAYLVQTGSGDENNMLGTRWLQGDVDVSKKLLKQAAIDLFKPESRNRASQNYAAWEQQQTELNQIDAYAQKLIATAGLKISQGSHRDAVMRELNDALQKLIPSAPAQNPTETAAANPSPSPTPPPEPASAPDAMPTSAVDALENATTNSGNASTNAADNEERQTRRREIMSQYTEAEWDALSRAEKSEILGERWRPMDDWFAGPGNFKPES